MRQIFKRLLKQIISSIPLFRIIFETQGTAAPVTLRTWFFQRVIGINRQAYWPMHFASTASNIKNIKIGIGTAPGLSPGCYIQGGGFLEIGDYTIIAPNVGIITSNHKIYDYTMHQMDTIKIGRYCWIGMNAVILPGVILGDHTIVAAAAVVTKSFPDGYCIVAGNPAKEIKRLDPSLCVEQKNRNEYYGYVPKKKFETFRRKHLAI